MAKRYEQIGKGRVTGEQETAEGLEIAEELASWKAKPKVWTTLVDYRSAHRVAWRSYVSNIDALRSRCNVRDVGFGENAMITKWRSMMLTEFEKSDANVFLWMDADIVCRGGGLSPIIDGALETKGIVGAICSKRGEGIGICCRLSKEECDKTHVKNIDELPDLLKATYVGSGLMAMHVDAIRKIGETVQTCSINGTKGFCMEMFADDGEWLSEDYALCYRANALGIPVHASPKVEALHIGDRFFSAADGQRGMKKQ